MKKLMFLLFFSSTFWGFTQNNYWILSPNYREIQTGTPTSLPQPLVLPNGALITQPNPTFYYRGEVSQYASNMITKPNGEIEFFIIDGVIYDKNGYAISALETTDQGYSIAQGASEVLVVPDPANCQRYYIVSTVVRAGSFEKIPFLFHLDMSLPNFTFTNPLDQCQLNGALLPFEISPGEFQNFIGIDDISKGDFLPPSPGPGKRSAVFMASSKQRADGSYKVFISNGDGIFVFTIDQTGFNFTNLFGFPGSGFNPYNIRGEMDIAELSNGNYRIAVPFLPADFTSGIDYEQSLYTAEITSDGNEVPGSVKIFNTLDYSPSGANQSARYRGVEFSEDGRYLYVTHTVSPLDPNAFEYYDFNNPTLALNPITLPVGLSQNDFQYSMIERGFSNKLYLSTQNGLYQLSDMSNPTSSITLANSFSNTPNYEGADPLTSSLKMFMLPDQIDGMDYQLFSQVNTQCCLDSRAFNVTTYSATTNAVWNTFNPLNNGFSVATIKKELRIPAGKTITISGMTLKFAPGARLVIEQGVNGGQGGKLILSNSVLTVDDGCGSDLLWLGVEVWGNQNQAQGTVTNSSQGVLRMTGNSRIEHAKIGILVSQRIATDPSNNGCYDEFVFMENSFNDSRNGGIVQANAGAQFFNNVQGVNFRKHISPLGANNVSFFTKATFTWDGPLKENRLPKDHIKMDQVKGINIRACAFNQLSPNLYNVNNQGYGINATLSQFYVNSQCNGITMVGQPCPSYTPSSFLNLRFGVFAYFANSALSFSVNESEFNNCRYGVYSSRSEDARVTNNVFNVREETYQTAGCLFDYSDGYKIEGNSFQEQDNASISNGQGNSYGVWINNSGVLNNEVYRNTFRNLKVGGQSDRVNGSQEGVNNDLTSGLKWKCNTFLNNIYTADLGVNGVIDKEQGTVNASTAALAQERAARNVFSIAANTGSEHDIMVFNYPSPLNVYPNQQTIDYVHLNDPFHIANDVDNLVVPQYAQFGGNLVVPFGNTCPSKLGSTSPIKKSKMEFHKSEIANLYVKIDGGNTSDLLDKATNFANQNTTYEALIDASPYLSDEVLLAYIENSTISGKTKNVVVANSQLSPVVYQAVMQANLPNGVKNFITNAQDQVSERQLLYSEIKWNRDEYAYYFNDLTSELLLDTTELADYTPLINELNLLDDKLAKVQLLDVYVELRNATLSEEIRDELDSLENPDYIELTIAIQELNDGLSNEKELNENETLKNQFINLRNNASCGMVSNSAKNILSCVFGVEDAPDFLPLQALSNIGMIYSTNEENTSEREIFEVKVAMYPNPSSGQVYFDLPDFEEGTLQIQLFDVTGKEVYSVNYFNTNGELVDFTSLKKGTYIVRITLGNDYNESHLLQLND